MKSITDPSGVLSSGLASIRAEFNVPEGFAPDVLAAAERASATAPSEHADRTALPFVTLDPASSTDLDQAFCIEESGGDLILRYAIADVAWFVRDGDPVDVEAWNRGETLYLPDGRAGLYPPILSENGASLLPAGPRPAILYAVRIDGDGNAVLDGVERALIKSRAKLAYDSVQAADLPPGFAAFARRIEANETLRGASRVDPPEQEVERQADGGYLLSFKPKLRSEEQNAALSLAANMAIADALFEHRTGLFRVMSEPDAGKVERLRAAARGLGLAWPDATSLRDYQRTLDPADPKQAALMLEIRRSSPGASYQPFREGVVPWHAAMAATYAHATAPLRRLADRYVGRAALAVANGQAVPQVVSDAFERLPKVMGRADARASQIRRAVIDLAEAVMLDGRAGHNFAAIVTDLTDNGARVQFCDLPIVARVDGNGFARGDRVELRLTAVDVAARRIAFEAVG